MQQPLLSAYMNRLSKLHCLKAFIDHSRIWQIEIQWSTEIIAEQSAVYSSESEQSTSPWRTCGISSLSALIRPRQRNEQHRLNSTIDNAVRGCTHCKHREGSASLVLSRRFYSNVETQEIAPGGVSEHCIDVLPYITVIPICVCSLSCSRIITVTVSKLILHCLDYNITLISESHRKPSNVSNFGR